MHCYRYNKEAEGEMPSQVLSLWFNNSLVFNPDD